VAYPECVEQRQDAVPDGREAGMGRPTEGERCEGPSETSGRSRVPAHTASKRRREARQLRRHEPAQRAASGGQALAHPASVGHPRPGVLTTWCRPEANGAWEAAYALSGGQLGQWNAEPDVGRVANGIPDRAHRLRWLGNAVVPQIPELIGRAILAAEAAA
jgi:DNA (cytosine-5)-methyltransferase 1